MLNQSFSIKNLRRLVRGSDLVRYGIERDDDKIEEAVTEIAKKIEDNALDFESFRVLRRGGKDIFAPNDFGVDLALRKVTDSLNRIYKVKQADRTRIVKQICTLITEDCPKYILKFDVKGFYENLDRNLLLKKITDDRILSYQASSLLNKMFESKQIKSLSGLPRGVGISATLSELYMRDIDREIMRIKEVYFYSRYVDDMIVFCIDSPDKIQKAVEKTIMKSNMELNKNKTKVLKVECDCIKNCRCRNKTVTRQSFNHLGYKFDFFDRPQHEKAIKISIAPSKIKKIKSRIVASFLDYVKTGNFIMLKKRIQFLTGTYFINKPSTDGRLKSGIRFNYSLINNNDSINELNDFLKKNIFARQGSYGRKIDGKLTIYKKRQLAKLCFGFGFNNGITHNFDSKELKMIRKCWFNEKL